MYVARWSDKEDTFPNFHLMTCRITSSFENDVVENDVVERERRQGHVHGPAKLGLGRGRRIRAFGIVATRDRDLQVRSATTSVYSPSLISRDI